MRTTIVIVARDEWWFLRAVEETDRWPTSDIVLGLIDDCTRSDVDTDGLEYRVFCLQNCKCIILPASHLVTVILFPWEMPRFFECSGWYSVSYQRGPWIGWRRIFTHGDVDAHRLIICHCESVWAQMRIQSNLSAIESLASGFYFLSSM
jgi:hypothetical protein